MRRLSLLAAAGITVLALASLPAHGLALPAGVNVAGPGDIVKGAPAKSQEVPSERLSDVVCRTGSAGPFPCNDVDLLSFVPADEFVGVEPSAIPGVSDIWGWTDPRNGDEYVIIGKSNGVSFFRITDPTNPAYLGSLLNTAAVQLTWHDVKVYKNHAFIVSESNPHGMRVFDLRRLRKVTEPQTWTEDARYPLPVAAHNIAINTETGFAYIVGGNAGIVVPDHCLGGLHMVNIKEPGNPSFAGCWSGDGYTHDTQCVIYRGPDRTHRGHEICFSSNENHVAIVDVTDKSSPVRLSRLMYPQTGYTHQGWLTGNHRYFLFGDETDELDHELNTRTLVADVSDLDNPRLIGEHLATTKAIDHNLYVRGRLVYQSNYAAGLRVLDTGRIGDGGLSEIAYFDTFPDHDEPEFVGTWSNYPFFRSRTIAVSGMGEGLFLLRLSR